MINAKDLFPTKEEFEFVKNLIDEWDGILTMVIDIDGQVIYESEFSYNNQK